MQNKLFIHHPLFRILVPLFYGIMVYIFILTLFDSLYRLKENFFSHEVILIIVITSLLMEGQRFLIILLDRRYPMETKTNLRLVLQLVLSLLYGTVITSAVVSAYFYFLVGYSSFLTEFLVFNIVFILTGILYTMLYFSVYYLNRQNVVMLSKENIIRENLEYELESFKNEIDPHFLYESLESLISMIQTDPIPAEKFISQLSGVYRYKLESKKNELVNLRDELSVTRNFIDILNVKYRNNILLETDREIDNVFRKKMVPGTIQIFIENAVRSNILNEIQPLKLRMKMSNDKYLILSHKVNERLIPENQQPARLTNILRAYSYYSDEPVLIKEKDGYEEVRIPLLEIIEEEL